METTIGRRIAALRKQKGMTQDELAEKMGVSPQAVSKWENDISCPDISILPSLARELGVTVDALLSGEAMPETLLVPEGQRKPVDQMILKVLCESSEGDKVRVNLPMGIVRVGLELGMNFTDNFNVNGVETLRNLDWQQLLQMVDHGVIGKLVEVESADGDRVEIWVE